MPGMGRDESAVGRPLGFALVEGVYGVFGALQQTVAAVLEELNLTEALADALWQLNPPDGPLPRRTLAERLHCDPSNVTFLVDRLEERGLAERVDSPGDRRVKAVALTAAGIAARGRLITATADSPTFARLTRNQQRQLADLLHQCIDPPAPPLHVQQAVTA